MFFMKNILSEEMQTVNSYPLQRVRNCRFLPFAKGKRIVKAHDSPTLGDLNLNKPKQITP